MKPTINELLAGAWRSYRKQEEPAGPPSTLDKEFVWEPAAALATAFGFPADTLFALHRTAPRLNIDWALVKIINRHGICWQAGILRLSRQKPGVVLLERPTDYMTLTSEYADCIIAVVGRLVPLEHYKRCPAKTQKACRR